MLFDDLLSHVGHPTEVVSYGLGRNAEAVYNVAVECTRCNVVLYDVDNPGRCDRCGERFTPTSERAEVVRRGEEAVPVEQHLIVHADPCYLAHQDEYELA